MAQPTITSVTPNFGSNLGNTFITITGANFLTGPAITIGGLSATSISFVSSTQVTCYTPAGTLGLADIILTNTDLTTVTFSQSYQYITPSVYHQIADVAGKFRNPTWPYVIVPGNSGMIITAAQVQGYVTQTEAIISSMLLHKGYALPITMAANPLSFPFIQKMCVAFTANDLYQILKTSNVLSIDPDDKDKIATFYYEGKDLYNKIQNDELILQDVPRLGSIIQSSNGPGLVNEILFTPQNGQSPSLPPFPNFYPWMW